MRAVPRSLYPTVSVITIGTHPFGVVRSLFVPTVIHLFSEVAIGVHLFGVGLRLGGRGEGWLLVVDFLL